MVDYLMCNHPVQDESKTFIEGESVRRCRICRMVTVEGAAQWITGGPDVLVHLKILAVERDRERATQKAIMESPIEDPRWTQIFP